MTNLKWSYLVKVGDLVELSAYGKKLKCNLAACGSVGLVTEVDNLQSIPQHLGTAITVQWCGHNKPMFQVRRDLKHLKQCFTQ